MADILNNRKVKLSQCMIVKNEENNMKRALSWGRGIMYEQIVVDTGSTDRTVELAEQMGAKVFHFQWIDDFSAAKNFAIDKAEGNWIAFLDADEYLTPEAAAKIPSLLEELHTSKYLVLLSELLNFDDRGKFFCGGTQIRLFRNLPALRYRHSIHEALYYHERSLNTSEIIDISEELAIYHDGYKHSAAGEGQKGRRNRPMILKELEQDPKSEVWMGYLADCYRVEKKMELALHWYEKAVAAMNSEICEYNIRGSMTFANLLLILALKQEESRLMEVYYTAIKKIPEDADFDYIVGRYFVQKEDYLTGGYHLERALNLLEQFGDNTRAANLTGNLPGTCELLALCHYNNGNLDKCVEGCVRLLKAQKYIMAALTMLLSAFGADQQTAGVIEFLSKLYDFSTLKDRVFVLKASMQAGCHELTAILRGTLSQEERDSFDRANAGK